MSKSCSVLFLGKRDDLFCERAADFMSLAFSDVKICLGKRGEPPPELFRTWEGTMIVSYLSPWIVPGQVLLRAQKAAINFHPGPPEYPGIGCTNFAIYNKEKFFGVTCHYMNAKVDTGEIIAVRRFPLYEFDTVYSLTQRCYANILVLFYETMAFVLERGPEFTVLTEPWKRLPYKRCELDALCEVREDMSEDEVLRRVRAVTYPGAPGAYIKRAGKVFQFQCEHSGVYKQHGIV